MKKKTREIEHFLEEGYIYESIVGIFDDGNEPVFSPVGMRFLGADCNDLLEFNSKIYCNSRLHRFLEVGKDIVIHFPNTSQPEFFLFAFKEDAGNMLSPLLEKCTIETTVDMKAPAIKEIEGKIIGRITRIENVTSLDDLAQDGGGSHSFAAVKIAGKFSKNERGNFHHTPPISRIHGLYLECLVLLSRVKIINQSSKSYQKNKKEITSLLGEMKRMSRDVKEVSICEHLIKKILK
ncbi:MAG: hypothetical protein ACTSUE_27545 [Promethearchaeota archaeon]